MEKTLVINEKEHKFRVSAATTYLYRDMFGKDLIRAFQRVEEGVDDESVTLMTQLAYVAARQGDPKIPPIEEWLEQFSSGDLLRVIIPCVAELWRKNVKATASPKK